MVNKRQMQTQESKVDLGKALDTSLVVKESSGTESGKQDTSSRSGNDVDADNADIKPVYGEKAMAEVQLTTECNVFATNNNMLRNPNSIMKEGLTKNEHLDKEKEHLKQTYKDLYDSIKKTRVQTKDHNDSLTAQLNKKSIENADLKAQIQEKETEYALAKPHHVISFSESRNCSKYMLRFSSNDMIHNHYLDEAKKKVQERDRNSKTSVMPSDRSQNTANGSKPKPRSTNQITRNWPTSKSTCVMITVVPKADHFSNSSSFSDSKYFVCSTCHKCVFNANHDTCITKFLNEVNSHAKVKSHKTRNGHKPIEPKSHSQKPGRQVFTGHMFSPNKSSTMYEKTSPRSCHRWKPTGRIFKTVGLRWIPTGKIFAFCTSKADSEPTHGSNVNISKIHECKQTLDLSAGTLINVKKEQSIDFSATTSYNVKQDNLRVWLLKKLISQKPVLKWIQNCPLFDEYFNEENQVVSKSFAVTTADASDKRQQQPDSTSYTSTLATTVTADGNFYL
ncbi:hypothetical protein Tco_0530560 [Tanacetum coccineum]